MLFDEDGKTWVRTVRGDDHPERARIQNKHWKLLEERMTQDLDEVIERYTELGLDDIGLHAALDDKALDFATSLQPVDPHLVMGMYDRSITAHRTMINALDRYIKAMRAIEADNESKHSTMQ